MKPRPPRIVSMTISALILSLSACSSAQRDPDRAAPSRDTAAPAESSVEITYVLGHSRRRFLAEARADQVLAQSFMEHQILRESAVDPSHYREFLGKAGRVVALPGRGLAKGGDDCRYPFKITVKNAGELKTASGCRGTDDGALGRLLRDGEFLLSARK